MDKAFIMKRRYLNDACLYVRWLQRLICLMYSRDKFTFIFLILLLIFSELCKILSFLAPLKILFLLSEGKLPNFMIAYVGGHGFESVIWGLVFISIFMFFMHYLSKWIVARVIKGEVNAFEFHDSEQLFIAMNDFYILMAMFFLSLIFIVLGFILNKGLMLTNIAYLLIVFSTIAAFVVSDERIYFYVSKCVQELLVGIFGLGFFVAFLYMVIDSLYGDYLGGILLTLLCIIITRQMYAAMQALSGAVKRLKYRKKYVAELFG